MGKPFSAEIHKLCSAPNVVKVTKIQKTRCGSHMPLMRKMRMQITWRDATDRRTHSGMKTHCVSQYDVDSSGSGLEPVRLVTLIKFSIPPTIHLWRYSPFRALVSLKTRLHSFLSSARLLHFRIPTICDVSLRTTFSHPLLGLPTGPVLQNFPLRNFSASLSSSINTIWPANNSLLILLLRQAHTVAAVIAGY